VHVRVACPPIIAPCFYGIDMSRIRELFAPPFMEKGLPPEEMFAEMAAELGADSLRYLPVEAIARAIGRPADTLCRACITGDYPTPWGQKLYQVALAKYESHADASDERTYEGEAAGWRSPQATRSGELDMGGAGEEVEASRCPF
jgi:amidophosphoribosyltransferase